MPFAITARYDDEIELTVCQTLEAACEAVITAGRYLHSAADSTGDARAEIAAEIYRTERSHLARLFVDTYLPGWLQCEIDEAHAEMAIHFAGLRRHLEGQRL